MKLLLDQGLPRSSVQLLNGHGIDAVHVGDIGLADAPDELILQSAATDGRIVVILDADFHALLARSGARAPSVVRIRIEGLKAEAVTAVITEVLNKASLELESGAVVSVTERNIRVHMLPLV